MSLWIKSLSVPIQVKAVEQLVPVVLFIMLYKVVLTFESVDAILQCDHSYESFQQFLLMVLIVFQYFTKISSGIFLPF